MKAILTYLETGYVEEIDNVISISINKGNVVIESDRGFWKVKPKDLIDIKIV